jgi:polar amino acid transport system substrate-binding protein
MKIILTLFLFLLTTALSAQTKVVKITNGEWPPYLSEKLMHYGAASFIVTESFKIEGYKVKYGFFPWSRSLELVKQPVWDASAVWLYSEERGKDFIYSDPVINSEYVFFHLKDYSFKWNSINDLKGISIGGTEKYFYGDEFENAEKAKEITVYRIASDELNFNLLLKKRIQIFPIDKNVGYHTIQRSLTEEQVAQITHHPKLIFTKPLYLIMPKDRENSKVLMDIFNSGLKKFKNKVHYQKIQIDIQDGKYSN